MFRNILSGQSTGCVKPFCLKSLTDVQLNCVKTQYVPCSPGMCRALLNRANVAAWVSA